MPELTRADLARLAALAEPYKDEDWRALEAQGDSYTAEPEWFVGMVPNDAGGWWDWDSSLLNRERAEFLVAAKSAIPKLCEALIEAWDACQAVVDAADHAVPINLIAELSTAIEMCRKALGKEGQHGHPSDG